MRQLFIISGIPGSGKSYLAEQLVKYDTRFICCADDFMVDKDGKYAFSPTKLSYVHKKCQQKCSVLMQAGAETIVVANTNTTTREMEPYVMLAAVNNYKVIFLEPPTPWRYDVNECFKKNTHGVPLDKLKQMLSRLVDLMDAKRYFEELYPSLELEYFVWPSVEHQEKQSQ